MTEKKLSVHQVLNEVEKIKEKLWDMDIAFISDLEPKHYAKLESITALNSVEVMEVLSFLFGEGDGLYDWGYHWSNPTILSDCVSHT